MNLKVGDYVIYFHPNGDINGWDIVLDKVKKIDEKYVCLENKGFHRYKKPLFETDILECHEGYEHKGDECYIFTNVDKFKKNVGDMLK